MNWEASNTSVMNEAELESVNRVHVISTIQRGRIFSNETRSLVSPLKRSTSTRPDCVGTRSVTSNDAKTIMRNYEHESRESHEIHKRFYSRTLFQWR